MRALLRSKKLQEKYGDVWPAAYHYNLGNKKGAVEILDNEIEMIERGIEKWGGSEGERRAVEKYKKLRSAIASGKEPPASNLYKVKLHPGRKDEVWLDWDKPVQDKIV